MATKKRSLVVGDSFVKRLERFHVSSFHHCTLEVKGTTVDMRGYQALI